MEKLSNPQKTIETIKKYEFAFQKKFGQNFLIDGHVLDKIIAAAEVTKEDCVVEINSRWTAMIQQFTSVIRTENSMIRFNILERMASSTARHGLDLSEH